MNIQVFEDFLSPGLQTIVLQGRGVHKSVQVNLLKNRVTLLWVTQLGKDLQIVPLKL